MDKMDNICVRLDPSLSKRIELDMREFHYSTKTDFVRDAIRTKLSLLDEQRSKKKAWDSLCAARGAFKGKALARTGEEEREFEKKIDGELLAHYGKKF
ncbi:MAG: ribbon-helix-helix domain-containing protein, partial [Candidatus Diapherotrites archaeon]|nr:ribbon-helix-helix domain-containing protein [Candidatus Diapherotrites archaeon]